MISIATTLILFTGFYALYNTSKRAELSSNHLIAAWLQNHPKFSKAIGLMLIFVSFFLITKVYGIGTGIFINLILLMLISSLVILLFPLKKEGKL